MQNVQHNTRARKLSLPQLGFTSFSFVYKPLGGHMMLWLMIFDPERLPDIPKLPMHTSIYTSMLHPCIHAGIHPYIHARIHLYTSMCNVAHAFLVAYSLNICSTKNTSLIHAFVTRDVSNHNHMPIHLRFPYTLSYLLQMCRQKVRRNKFPPVFIEKD